MSRGFATDVVQLGGSAGVELRQGATDPTTAGGVAAPLNSLYYQTSTSLVWQKIGAAATAWVSLTPQALFGDGSDGPVTIAAGTTTLAKDTFATDLTVQNGGILVMAGFRLWVRGTLNVQAGGTIRYNGAAAAGTAGAGNTAAGTWGTTTGGGGASTTTNGNNGTGSAVALPGFGGSGGAGGTGAGGAAGNGGTITVATAARGNLRNLIAGGWGQFFSTAGSQVTWGSGGGGGAGSGATAGGGGGAGGGGVMIFAHDIINSGAIEAKGGAGFTTGTANAGGGGGGGGGLIILGFHTFAGTAPDVSGGAGGNGGAGGGNGANGNAGVYVPLQL